MVITIPDIVRGTYGSTYDLRWDGWRGQLDLRADGSGALYTAPRTVFSVRHQLVVNPSDTIDGRQGPGYLGTDPRLDHRIVFWVEFGPQQEQRFDGYFFTQTKDAMAGVTWWNDAPFGFYARYVRDIVG